MDEEGASSACSSEQATLRIWKHPLRYLNVHDLGGHGGGEEGKPHWWGPTPLRVPPPQ